jgi:cellulose synthase/poly-beta-1,6-N-acetylglucosamine synthase-like glycosyltransferase
MPLGVEYRVSVIIPYYNQPVFLAEAVSSVGQQIYPNVEITLVDDGSIVPADSILPQVSGIRNPSLSSEYPPMQPGTLSPL